MPCVHSYLQHGQYNDERVHQKDAWVCNTESVQGRIRTVNSADSIHITRVYLTLQGGREGGREATRQARRTGREGERKRKMERERQTERDRHRESERENEREERERGNRGEEGRGRERKEDHTCITL